jgi:hypothetical protein
MLLPTRLSGLDRKVEKCATGASLLDEFHASCEFQWSNQNEYGIHRRTNHAGCTE